MRNPHLEGNHKRRAEDTRKVAHKFKQIPIMLVFVFGFDQFGREEIAGFLTASFPFWRLVCSLC